MKYEPIIEGSKNQCKCCPPIPTQACMNKVIAVGFGAAYVSRDGLLVLDGEKRYSDSEDGEDLLTFADAEEVASKDPDHDWRVVFYGPLHGETYQRQGEKAWLCIERNDGFA